MPALFIFLLTLFFSPSLPAPCLGAGIVHDSVPQAFLSDDLDLKSLKHALEKSCHHYETAAAQFFDLCGQRLSGRQLAHGYRHIITLLQDQSNEDIGPFLRANFTACKATPILVTAYYTPILTASLTPSHTYRFPIYGLPDREDLRTLTRAAIDNSRHLQGYEIAYLADPVDLFFLHVQGSGIIEFADGNRSLVSFAGDNGKPYTSIGKILIQEGKLTRQEVSLATIKAYLGTHPEESTHILHQNERYIYFSLREAVSGETLPTGSLGYALTPGRSVAMDSNHYPPGILGIMTGRIPQFNGGADFSWQPFSRLVTHQDSGAAIKGPHRLDLYLGIGKMAGQQAGLMKEKGTFAILIPNLSLRQVHSKIISSQQTQP